MENKKCFVHTYENGSINNPNMIFVQWCREVNVICFKVYTIYCCEDHFEPTEDLVHCFKVKIMKYDQKLERTVKLRNISILNEIHAAKQCDIKMVDKSTNHRIRETTSARMTAEILSSREVSSTATPSLFGSTSEMEE